MARTPCSLHTAEVIARFGKPARYPVCQAALQLWQIEAEMHKFSREALSVGELLINAKRQKKRARTLLDQFYEKGKQKEAIQAAEVLEQISRYLPKLEQCHRAKVQLFDIYDRELHPLVTAQFRCELSAIARENNVKAITALRKTRKRWNDLANGASLKNSDMRSLGTLSLLRDKTTRAVGAKAGAAATYTEAVFGGDRPLYDEVWKGRLTAKEIRSHLEAAYGPRVAGDKDAKEVRRTAKKLRIRLAADQRGRKHKPSSPKKDAGKRPVGRPATSTRPQLSYTNNLEGIEASLVNPGRVVKVDSWTAKDGGEVTYFTAKEQRKIIANIDRAGLAWARKIVAGMEREIKRIELLRGGRKGLYEY